MGVTNSNQVINADRIECGGELRVTLSVTAAPNIVSNPTDIVLVLDRSGSMAGEPLKAMKLGAKTFLEIIDQATDGAGDGQVGFGSRMGIVSFSDTARADTQLITSTDMLKAAVEGLTAGGKTNHADAFAKAAQLFDLTSANARVIVLFTDGKTTAGMLPAPVAEAARAQGITIYCIGLVGTGGLDVQTLNDWASDPDASHVSVAADAAELERLFAQLAANISKPGATEISIQDTVSADFIITRILPPEKGSAEAVGDRSLRWEIPELGVSAEETALLEFLVQHVGQNPGNKIVSESILYSDAEGNVVTFPTPSVEVECPVVVHTEECPAAVDFSAQSCADTVVVDAGQISLSPEGQIVELDVTVTNVCPGKRVALAAILTEVDAEGVEYQRGIRTLTIPAHHFSGCRDVLVRCIKFVVPGDLNGSEPCGSRNFRARFIANGIDEDTFCCDAQDDP